MISGASGGVGLTAAQLARRAGAEAIGIAIEANAGRLREHGTRNAGGAPALAERRPFGKVVLHPASTADH